MIKTQSPAESKFLRRILAHYYSHVMSYPHSYITRFFGMHRLKMPHLRRSVHFVVMQSVFASPEGREVHEMFDLKGSSVGRSASEKERASGPSRCVYKDNDLVDSDTVIKLGPGRREAFLAQIAQDASFLQSMGIMDYSLLLGIHHRSRHGAGEGHALVRHGGVGGGSTATAGGSGASVQAQATVGTASGGAAALSSSSSSSGPSLPPAGVAASGTAALPIAVAADGASMSAAALEGDSEAGEGALPQPRATTFAGSRGQSASRSTLLIAQAPPGGALGGGVAALLGLTAVSAHSARGLLPPSASAASSSPARSPSLGPRPGGGLTSTSAYVGIRAGEGISASAEGGDYDDGASGSGYGSATDAESLDLPGVDALRSVSAPTDVGPGVTGGSSASTTGSSALGSAAAADGYGSDGVAFLDGGGSRADHDHAHQQRHHHGHGHGHHDANGHGQRPLTPDALMQRVAIGSHGEHVTGLPPGAPQPPPGPQSSAGGGIPGCVPRSGGGGASGSSLALCDEVYFLGIIDILQQYDLRKVGETALKSLVHPSREISAVSPAFYAQRFVRFLEAHTA